VKYILNLIGEQVIHGLFGVGRILSIEADIVTIQFSDRVGQKKFQYPHAFEHYLKMCRPSAQEQIDKELKVLLDAIEVERVRKEKLRLKEKEQRLTVKSALKKTLGTKKSKVSNKKADSR
jgi:hypothetical protein